MYYLVITAVVQTTNLFALWGQFLFSNADRERLVCALATEISNDRFRAFSKLLIEKSEIFGN